MANDNTERARAGLGRKKQTREEIGKGNQLTALRFQTGDGHQTSQASLRGQAEGRVLVWTLLVIVIMCCFAVASLAILPTPKCKTIDTDCLGVFRQTRKNKSKCHQRRPASRAYRYKYWTADNRGRGEPEWPSGKALGCSRGTSVRVRFGSSFSSKVSCGV